MERKLSVFAIEIFKENLEAFSEAVEITYLALNRIINDVGVSDEVKNVARGTYLTKLSYFKLQREYVKSMKENLIKDEKFEIVNMLLGLENQIEFQIEATLKELNELDAG